MTYPFQSATSSRGPTPGKGRYALLRVLAALTALVLCAPLARAAVMDVAALREAGATLEFVAYDGARILPYEPLSGALVLVNRSAAPIEYKVSLLRGEGVVLKVLSPTGAVLHEAPLLDGPVPGRGRPRLATLAPGERHERRLVFRTGRTPLDSPGVYRIAFALTDNGNLQTQPLNVTVVAAAGADRAVLDALMALDARRLRNPTALAEHLASDPPRAYMERIAAIVSRYPTSRYSAALAKEMTEYWSVAGATYRRTEDFLRIAAEHGGTVVAGDARLELAKMLRDMGREAEADEALTGLESSSDPRIRARARTLRGSVPPSGVLAPAGARDVPAVLASAEQEAALIMQAVQGYYDALVAGDAAALARAIGQSPAGAGALLGRFRAELAGKGIDALTGVHMPPAGPANVRIMPVRGSLYSVHVSNIEVRFTRAGKAQRRVIKRAFRVRRDAAGGWVVAAGG